MDDLLEGLLAGAADGCIVVVGAFLALILLGALVSLLFEPAFWLLAAMAGIAAAVFWWGRRGRSEPTADSRVQGENGHAEQESG
jgi:membrane protein implicated in regulation of membrane protease activity